MICFMHKGIRCCAACPAAGWVQPLESRKACVNQRLCKSISCCAACLLLAGERYKGSRDVKTPVSVRWVLKHAEEGLAEADCQLQAACQCWHLQAQLHQGCLPARLSCLQAPHKQQLLHGHHLQQKPRPSPVCRLVCHSPQPLWPAWAAARQAGALLRQMSAAGSTACLAVNAQLLGVPLQLKMPRDCLHEADRAHSCVCRVESSLHSC